MPMAWIEPQKFVQIDRKRAIYHAYKDDEADHVLDYWYTTDPNENPDFQFDVRELDEFRDAERRSDHEAVIREAVKHGKIKFPE